MSVRSERRLLPRESCMPHKPIVERSQTPARKCRRTRLPATSRKTGPSTSEPKGQELFYAAHSPLDRTHMRVEDNLVNLSPGTAVTVEVKAGSRAIITYLLSPLLSYKQESLLDR
jgi:hypothetical protein